ncbi:ubiquinol-cytochrome c reductase core subunit 1 [Microbotryomycetes sp. JL221]|nr:ubiquinol-cytochrome c reductase core subunit 1 [Microbotryomycetes sp. JL221]
MSFAVRSGSRVKASVARQARLYATSPSSFSVADVNGVKLATKDEALSTPTGAISVIVKAGSRFEPQPGVAHCLKNALFKGTNKRSALRLVRETEALGGVLSASLSREHLILTAEFIKGDEPYFAEVLGDALTQAKLAPHEFNEDVVPAVIGEYEQAIHNARTYAFDLAHGLAFRQGLGNSLYASPHTAIQHSDLISYANNALSPSNLTVLASGVDNGSLKSFVSEYFSGAGAAAGSVSSAASTYYGGEVRVPAIGHSASDLFLLAFKGDSKAEADLVVLKFLLGGESSIKWSAGSSLLSKVASGSTTAKAFNLSYSDTGLFGIVVEGRSNEITGVASAAVAELKKVASGADGEAVKRAVAQAKFAAASALEARVPSLESVGAQIANNGSVTSLEDVFAKLDKVTAESVSKVAAEALKSKPTTVAVGNPRELPYADTVGL